VWEHFTGWGAVPDADAGVEGIPAGVLSHNPCLSLFSSGKGLRTMYVVCRGLSFVTEARVCGQWARDPRKGDAFCRLRRAVDAALVSGRWDSVELLEEFPELSPGEVCEEVRKYVNEG
jgi:hypothetical protein